MSLLGEFDRTLEGEDVNQQMFLIFSDLLESWEPAYVPFMVYATKLMPWHALHYVRQIVHYRSSLHAGVRSDVEDGEYGRRIKRVEESEPSPEDEIEARLSWMEITDKLDAQQKRWVVLRYQHGLTSSQIASITGYSRRTIDRKLHSLRRVPPRCGLL